MNDVTRAYVKMLPTEQKAFYEHQKKIADRDLDKRRRAMRDYRRYLDYLLLIGRISQGERDALEYYRIDTRRHA